MKVGAVILASGFSSRMDHGLSWQGFCNSGGHVNKLLIPYRGKSLVEHVMDHVAGAGFCRVIVVTAYEAVADMARCRKMDVVINSQPGLGQSRSVVLGVQAGRAADGLMFIPGDMPFLTPQVFFKMLLAYEEHSGCIVRAVYGHGPGSPVIFPRTLYGELEQLTGDEGGRKLLLKYPEKVVGVKIDDPIAGIDIDTPGEAKRWLDL